MLHLVTVRSRAYRLDLNNNFGTVQKLTGFSAIPFFFRVFGVFRGSHRTNHETHQTHERENHFTINQPDAVSA